MTDRSDDQKTREGSKRQPTKEEYQARLDKITAIFSGMVQHADELSLLRCPYKNRFSQCTAKFGCRYQDRSGDGETIGCKSDDKLDYRTAWDADPKAAEDMHEKLRTGHKS